MKNKTKDELIALIEEQQEKIERLENDVDYWKSEYEDTQSQVDDLECEIADLEMKGGINDLSNFIFRLKVDGLWCDMLEKFIKEYMRYHNE